MAEVCRDGRAEKVEEGASEMDVGIVGYDCYFWGNEIRAVLMGWISFRCFLTGESCKFGINDYC